MLRIAAVCSFGVGSSMILKITIDKALQRLGVQAETEVADISSARGLRCDAIFTSAELAEELRKGTAIPIFPIKRYMDVEEVSAAVLRLTTGHQSA